MRKNKYRYKKPYLTKKKKSILRNFYFWLAFFILVVFGTLFYLAVFSSYFQINEIKISGNKKIAFEDLKNLINGQINKKIIFFDTKSIFLTNIEELNKMILEKFPQIAKVKLNRKFPNILLVQIEERVPVALFSQDENYFFIDKEGIIFAKISEIVTLQDYKDKEEARREQISNEVLMIKKSTLVSDIELGREVVEKRIIDVIFKISLTLKDDFKIPLEEVLIISEERLNVKTSEGWEIYFNPAEDLNWQLTELNVLLKERIPPDERRNLEYIDLRFSRVYYKYR